jgi:hypothetical protein
MGVPLLITPASIPQAHHQHPHHHGVFLTPADAASAASSPDGALSPTRSDYSWDDSYDCNGAFLFNELSELIEKQSARAATRRPADSFSSRAQFNAYWSQVYAEMTETAALKMHISENLFLPRREFMRVRFVNDEEKETSVFLEAPMGEAITKDFFLRRLAETLYGEPGVGVRQLIGLDEDRPVISGFSWTKSNGGEHLRGPLTVRCTGLSKTASIILAD